MIHTTAAEKVKQIIETWEHATNHAPTGEWSADIFLNSPSGSRLIDSLVDEIDYKAKYENCINIIKRFDAGIIGMYDL